MAVDIDTVTDALLDNADFEAEGSVAKAKLFATAAKQFLILNPQSQSDQGSSLTISVGQIKELLSQAQAYTRAASTTSTHVRFLSASEGFRR